MRSIIVKILANGAAIWVATVVIPGVSIEGETLGETLLSLAVVGALFGLINTFIKPVVKLFSFPLYIVTLGLFAFVVNALLLELVSWLSDKIGISFAIDSFFWSALGAAVVVTFVSMVLNAALPDKKDE